jgi:exportin-2 (importin alpha re-exporter)
LETIVPKQDVQPLPEQDKHALRSQLVPAMLSLSDPSDKAVRAQVADTISLIAELDFPAKWPNLIDVRSPCSIYAVLTP